MPHRSQDPRAVAERLRSALDLMGAGIALMRQRMRREHPELTSNEVDAQMLRWLRARSADAPTRRVSWPRSGSWLEATLRSLGDARENALGKGAFAK